MLVIMVVLSMATHPVTATYRAVRGLVLVLETSNTLRRRWGH